MNGFPIAILIGFPFFFAGVWFLVTGLLSVTSGWRKLAARFENQDEFRGTVHRFQSARISGVNFNGVLRMGVGGEGLHLVPVVLFRAFHKPLLIPWEEIQAEELRGLLTRGRRLTFRSVPGVTVDISEKTFEKLEGRVRA